MDFRRVNCLEISIDTEYFVSLLEEKEAENAIAVLDEYHVLELLMEKKPRMMKWLMKNHVVIGEMRSAFNRDILSGTIRRPVRIETLIKEASAHSARRGRMQVGIRDIAIVILERLGYQLADDVRTFIDDMSYHDWWKAME